MRNRILAGVGVAALATLGLAAPANAVSDTTADVWVVHAVPGVNVDVWINGEPGPADLLDFAPEEVVPLVDLEPGEYVIDIQPAGVDLPGEGEGLITLTADVAAGVSYTLVAHPEVDAFAGGELDVDLLTISAFENNISELAAGETRVTARHTADAPAVDILANGGAIFEDVVNGVGADIDVPADTYTVGIAAAGSTDAIFEADLDLAAGTAYFVHAFGNVDDLGVVVFTIDGLGAAPEGVPAGGAGLVAESGNSALLGGAAALLIALLAAAGIIARRATVSSK
jgi:hypothetical protein